MVKQVEFAKSFSQGWLFPTAEGSQAAKEGWALTFESIAVYLNIELVTSSGLRKFTGHTARATGAVHMALNQVELWRIQLFGRWGSDCFKIYVRSAPLSQLTMLAKETSVQTSLLVARQELQALLKQIKQVEVLRKRCRADWTSSGTRRSLLCSQQNIKRETSQGQAHVLFLVLRTQQHSRLSDSDRGSRWSTTMLQMFSATQSIRWKARWWFRHQFFIVVFMKHPALCIWERFAVWLNRG